MTDLDVEKIEKMDRDSLVALWKDLIPERVPRRVSTAFLRHVLAFEVQCQRHGGLPSGFTAQLQKLAKGSPSKKTNAKLQAGGRLLREWNGITHVVDIAADHYVWKEQSFKSLSAIARAITGAHWSGPRFFGLNKAKKL